MAIDLWPDTSEFLDAFCEEVAGVGGKVTDSFADAPGGLLIARAVLPKPRDVAPGDRLQGGVALRATDHEVHVHPYVFRQVCTNGAIVAQAIETRVIRRGDLFDVLPEVREAVRECCGEEVFAKATLQIRAARHSEVDMMLAVMPFLSRLPASTAGPLLRQFTQNLSKEGDSSAFGVMQAITATARDTSDPDLRWRLEELGAGILARPRSGRQARPAIAKRHEAIVEHVNETDEVLAS